MIYQIKYLFFVLTFLMKAPTLKRDVIYGKTIISKQNFIAKLFHGKRQNFCMFRKCANHWQQMEIHLGHLVIKLQC